MSDTAMQEHERTVSAARIGMSVFDSMTPLRRWFDNYKEERGAFLWSSDIIVVTRDGRRWKVESTWPDRTEPYSVKYCDPTAPQPPIFEWRPPPPEPVKPRFTVPEPHRVPAWDRGAFAHRYMEQMMRELVREPMRITYDLGIRDDFSIMRYRYIDRPMFDRVAAPVPPPPTRRNQ